MKKKKNIKKRKRSGGTTCRFEALTDRLRCLTGGSRNLRATIPLEPLALFTYSILLVVR